MTIALDLGRKATIYNTYLNIFFSETAWPIELKFHMEYALDKTIYYILFQVT